MTQLTEFGMTVRKRLIEIGQTQTWLISQVNAKTGLYVDGGYLRKILTGARTAPKIVNAINDILGLEEAS